jgi:hypothetical protein
MGLKLTSNIYYMIKWVGAFLLIIMLGISCLLQIFIVNQKYTCEPLKNINCTIVHHNCEYFFDTLDGRSSCCPNIGCFCDDYTQYNFHCNFMYADNSDFDRNFPITVFIGFMLTIATTSSIFYTRRFFLSRMGLTKQELLSIDTDTRGFRDKFPEEKALFLSVREKLLHYNDESIEKNKIRIRAIDFFGRKSLHFVSMIIFTYFPTIFLDGSPLPTYSGIAIYSFMEFLCGLLVWNWIYMPKNKRKYIAPMLLGGHNRIQDGYASLMNVSTALFTGVIRTLTTAGFYLFVQKDLLLSFGKNNYHDYNLIKRIFLLVWVLNNNGVSFGDTAGEGIGAFLGKHRFKVRGFSGQENERSIEGCLGVFFFTGISDVTSIFFCSNLFDIYTFETIMLVFLLSVATMFFEMVSFKGTDNFIICFSNEIIIYIWLLWINDDI